MNTYDARNQRTRTDGFGTVEAYTTQYSYDLEDRLKTVDPRGRGCAPTSTMRWDVSRM